MNISKNDKVVLVNDDWPAGIERIYQQLPVTGCTYVVRDVFPATDMDRKVMDCHRVMVPGILLVGIVNERTLDGIGAEKAFRADRFRKLVEAEASAVETNKATV